MDAELSKINYLVDDAVPMKVTLPKSLAEDLAVYSNAKGMSKSDVMRDALIARINYDPEWMSRRYFIKKEKVDYDMSILDEGSSTLEVLIVGSLTQELFGHNSFQYMYCRIVGIDGDLVKLQPTRLGLPDFSAYTFDISPLIIPKSMSLAFGGINQGVFDCIYTLDKKYIWGIYQSQPPQFTFGL
ncbi:hypothetical protein [Acinetobacter baumannii]|uniref:hypothetical protein n=1 Tax=Acinetobacter baumannii TaxID=470 RepID=UPI001F28C26F|nr:hypothetical protein [Acinetobacter baumannii]MCF1331486.1 hypothetical protein [Acinetobacter baumannii]MDC4829110.1 hypothetical protein [Acinetobacter baumannii]UOE71930.1 hypothetical protein IVB58_13855 [Acinetobacter baumannii]HAV4196088.1 hypothetical protein [Acinetobacter baumannii]HEN9576645.1 hypothetical protein [Acinetobacter baumannii]